MHIISKYNNFCKYGILIFCFILLSGFEFETAQKEIMSAESLIKENKNIEAEELLKSILGDLKEPAEKNTELEIKMANGMFIPSVYYKLGEMNYDQNNYESAIAYFQEIINLEVHPRWNNIVIYY